MKIIEKFLEKGDRDIMLPIWRRVQSTKNGKKLRTGLMSYSRANELFKNELKKEGLDSKKYGLHCSGGASTAASLGILAQLLQRQGGWRTASAKNNYIDEFLDPLLLVTKSMQS